MGLAPYSPKGDYPNRGIPYKGIPQAKPMENPTGERKQQKAKCKRQKADCKRHKIFLSGMPKNHHATIGIIINRSEGGAEHHTNVYPFLFTLARGGRASGGSAPQRGGAPGPA